MELQERGVQRLTVTMEMVEVKSLSGIVGERRQYILTKIRMKNITANQKTPY